MLANIGELCNDPLFQLNLAIWLSQPTPDHFPVKSIFYKSGYSIHSIGPPLTLPLDIRLIIKESLPSSQVQDGSKPDLILEADKRKKFLILECKRSSFGPSSTTSRQARTLLLFAGPILSEVLGGVGKRFKAKGILSYFTKSDQIQRLEDTLSELTQELKSINLEPGDYSGLGLSIKEDAILLEYSNKTQKLLGLNTEAPVKIIDLEKDTDPRPLYFIPYDPDPNIQSKEEQSYGRRVLYNRFHVYILEKIGSTSAPSDVLLKTDEILTSVTFGIYEKWDDREAKKNIRGLLKNFMDSLRDSLKEEQKSFMECSSIEGWKFYINDSNSHEELLTQISKFKPETLDLSKTVEPEQTGLFDNEKKAELNK